MYKTSNNLFQKTKLPRFVNKRCASAARGNFCFSLHEKSGSRKFKLHFFEISRENWKFHKAIEFHPETWRVYYRIRQWYKNKMRVEIFRSVEQISICMPTRKTRLASFYHPSYTYLMFAEISNFKEDRGKIRRTDRIPEKNLD